MVVICDKAAAEPLHIYSLEKSVIPPNVRFDDGKKFPESSGCAGYPFGISAKFGPSF